MAKVSNSQTFFWSSFSILKGYLSFLRILTIYVTCIFAVIEYFRLYWSLIAQIVRNKVIFINAFKISGGNI